jgi:hypothetical protein
VRVPDSENREAKKVHPEIRGVVEEELEQVIRTFLSGSYSRKVQVVKLNDVDVIVVLDDPDGTFANSAKDALEAIREAAKGSDLVRHTKLGVRAVKLFLHGYEFTVDLVAAREPDSGEEGLLLARHLPRATTTGSSSTLRGRDTRRSTRMRRATTCTFLGCASLSSGTRARETRLLCAPTMRKQSSGTPWMVPCSTRRQLSGSSTRLTPD